MNKTLLFILCCYTAVAQQTDENPKAVSKGDHYITVNMGSSNYLRNSLPENVEIGPGYQPQISYVTWGTGPFFLRYEYQATDQISFGAVLAYLSGGTEKKATYVRPSFSGSKTYSATSMVNVTTVSFGGRFNYHFLTGAKFDPYVGAALGYTKYINDISYETDDGTNDRLIEPLLVQIPIYLGITAGARFYITKHFALNAEVGVDKWSAFMAGVTWKF